MKTAYLDCASGISGDMTLAALVDVGVDLATIQAGIDSLGLKECRLKASEVTKNGFRATQITVEHPPEHAHRHLCDIEAMIDGSQLTDQQQDCARRIFLRLAEAEAKVHGTTTDKVHFHEVGAVDSIADIVGVAIGWDLLQVDNICASPIPTGTGSIEIAHGRCSIPAPATAELLIGIPLADSAVEAELTTPTGAAIAATLVDQFGPLPAMTIQQIGYGAGQRDLAGQPNLLRLLVGTTTRSLSDSVWIVETNLDDATGELVGHLSEQLFLAGAVDVYTTPIQMKKNRPGALVTALCHAAVLEQVEATFIRESTTLGVRRWQAQRSTLRREPHEVATPWGNVRGVVAWRENGKVSFAPEYEACRSLATSSQIPLREIYLAAQQAFDPQQFGDA
jgi:uncharacterized protein (TIGR00299 family) protein